MTVGFLFNRDQVHQVLHTLPIALTLAEARTGGEIALPMTNNRLRAEGVRHAGPAISCGDLSLIELTDVRIETDYLLDRTRIYYSPGIAVRHNT